MEHAILIKKVEELKKELAITDQLLAEQHRVIDLIPECPIHGNRCVPHAIEWITNRTNKIPPASGDLFRHGHELAKRDLIETIYI